MSLKLEDLTVYQLLITFIAILIIVVSCKVCHRLYFHRLATFPGPPLAAVTSLCTAYYDLILDGSLVKHLLELHKEYGNSIQ